MLLIWHIRMIHENKTTIEHAEVSRRLEHGGLLLHALWQSFTLVWGMRATVRFHRLALQEQCASCGIEGLHKDQGQCPCCVLCGCSFCFICALASVCGVLQGVTAQIKQGASGKDRLRHPYDIGPCENIHQFFGDDPFTWLLPHCRSTPPVTSYPTTFDKKADFFSF